MVIKSHKFLGQLYFDLCQKWGAPEHQCHAFSEAILAGDLLGHVAQGNVIAQIADLMVSHNQINLTAEPEIEKETGSFAVMNGHHGLGQYVMKKATEKAIEIARQNTIGIVWVHDWHDIGCASAFTKLALKENMFCMLTINSVPLTAPYGGRDMVMSAAPLAFVCPAKRNLPVMGDMALCQTYDYYFNLAIQNNEKLPGKWLVDPETGELTDDPAPFVDDPAHRSSGVRVATAFQDPKLYVVNILSELLTGLLTPGGWTSNLHEYPSRDYLQRGEDVKRGGGGFILVVDPAQLMPFDHFLDKVDSWIDVIKGGGLQKGFQEILLPGERALKEEQKRLAEGVPVLPDQWAKLCEMSEKVGIDIAALEANFEAGS
jgi:LDH2 family malate/lactate/ureidoglycolate dehydrogenase